MVLNDNNLVIEACDGVKVFRRDLFAGEVIVCCWLSSWSNKDTPKSINLKHFKDFRKNRFSLKSNTWLGIVVIMEVNSKLVFPVLFFFYCS